MKKFDFKFSTILKVRKGREDECLRELGAAQRAYQFELKRKADLIQNLNDALTRREQLGSTPTNVIAFKTEQEFINGTKKRIIQADQNLVRANKKVEKAMRAYLVARRQTRMIEVLREKAFSEYKKEMSKLEQKELDNQSIMRARFREEIA